jgi:hypothetical protein
MNVRVPRVGDLPVLDAAINTPANELDGVATGNSARGVLVDATGVVLKVRVHGEGGLRKGAEWQVCVLAL